MLKKKIFYMKNLYLLLIVAATLFTSCAKWEEKPEFEKFYTELNLTGSMLVYDVENNTYYVYNKERTEQEFLPASTFKIFNALVALETGVIKDENVVFEWDSVDTGVEVWNQNQDMKTAFRYSTIWYFKQLARKAGDSTMNAWVKKEKYGNMDISGGIDKFWLSGNLRITQQQQIEFLQKLYENKLSFSQRTMDIVKKVMVYEENDKYKISAKTGWTKQDGKEIGWFVGYVEKDNKVYYFANNIETTDAGNDFINGRSEITKKILTELKIIE